MRRHHQLRSIEEFYFKTSTRFSTYQFIALSKTARNKKRIEGALAIKTNVEYEQLQSGRLGSCFVNM
uniref:Uncharacterized protein n=1 Tax=Strigamia maritima TaxID=126957 RepID=T1IVT2_STRMM